jgi:small subunit ribosomal protein S20
MAHHLSAKKRIRQTERRTAVNRSRVSRIRTFVRKAEETLAAGNPVEAKAAVLAVESELMSGVSKGVVPKNTAARKVSRLVKRLKLLKAA